MKLYRLKYFNSDRPYGQKLLDIYVLSKDMDTATKVVVEKYNIGTKDSSLHEMVAGNGRLFNPSRHSDNLQLFKTIGTPELYIVDTDLGKVKKRLQRVGISTKDIDFRLVNKPFIISGLRKK